MVTRKSNTKKDSKRDAASPKTARKASGSKPAAKPATGVAAKRAKKTATRSRTGKPGLAAGSAGAKKSVSRGKAAAPKKTSTRDGGSAGAPARRSSRTKTAATRSTSGVARTPAKSRANRSPASASGRAATKRASSASRERIEALERARLELQDALRGVQAERDSTLAEVNRLQERVRELETESSRRATREPQPAGPGDFDPELDLQEGTEDEDYDETAGFFDRMEDLRARRIELDRERTDRELRFSEQPFWMTCPKCGEMLDEQEVENIKLERCEACGGIYIDRGETDLLLTVTAEAEGARRLHTILKF